MQLMSAKSFEIIINCFLVVNDKKKLTESLKIYKRSREYKTVERIQKQKGMLQISIWRVANPYLENGAVCNYGENMFRTNGINSASAK